MLVNPCITNIKNKRKSLSLYNKNAILYTIISCVLNSSLSLYFVVLHTYFLRKLFISFLKCSVLINCLCDLKR